MCHTNLQHTTSKIAALHISFSLDSTLLCLPTPSTLPRPLVPTFHAALPFSLHPRPCLKPAWGLRLSRPALKASHRDMIPGCKLRECSPLCAPPPPPTPPSLHLSLSVSVFLSLSACLCLCLSPPLSLSVSLSLCLSFCMPDLSLSLSLIPFISPLYLTLFLPHSTFHYTAPPQSHGVHLTDRA